MHEISICQQLIKQVDDVALQNQASKVTGIQPQLLHYQELIFHCYAMLFLQSMQN